MSRILMANAQPKADGAGQVGRRPLGREMLQLRQVLPEKLPGHFPQSNLLPLTRFLDKH